MSSHSRFCDVMCEPYSWINWNYAKSFWLDFGNVNLERHHQKHDHPLFDMPCVWECQGPWLHTATQIFLRTLPVVWTVETINSGIFTYLIQKHVCYAVLYVTWPKNLAPDSFCCVRHYNTQPKINCLKSLCLLWRISDSMARPDLQARKGARTQNFQVGFLLMEWGSFRWRGGCHKVRYVPRSLVETNFLAGYPEIFAGVSWERLKAREKVCVQCLSPMMGPIQKKGFGGFGGFGGSGVSFCSKRFRQFRFPVPARCLGLPEGAEKKHSHQLFNINFRAPTKVWKNECSNFGP